ncbi:MAG: family 20 glycosylhydrolase [Candidatus Omnitrophica bacterium]|nr:family 20 glycosylhydrolase [Candidatus Omnitrophota bacterium]
MQLDLARQRETLGTIRTFISFARDWGYNTLLLYLEGVVRTKSFPYRPASASYRPKDIQKILEMADKAGLDVIPGIGTLGHAEHFLRCRQLQHLAETGSWYKDMFCPSKEETYRFLEQYLAEIAVLFPGKNFHIGCDETWGLGACPVCRKRIQNNETKEDLLVVHILRVHKILQGFGKRAWIWDDMFENDPGEKIAQLPRDIVLCAWHYDSEQMDRDGFQGHFNNLRRLDTLGLYRKLGFDAVVCPSANYNMGINNTMAITEVAREDRVLGGLQTTWELANSFLPGVLPGIALAGALWSNPTQPTAKTLRKTLKRLLPDTDTLTLTAIREAISGPLWSIQSPEYYLRGTMTPEEVRALNSFIVCEQILRNRLKKIPTGPERDIIEELHVNLRLQILAGQQRALLPKLLDPRIKVTDTAEQKILALECISEFDALIKLRARQWKRFRAGIKPEHASHHLLPLKNKLQVFLDDTTKTPVSARGLLDVRLFLWDCLSAPKLKIELASNKKWHLVYSGSFKPVNLRNALFNLQLPLKRNSRDPEKIRFTVSGYGGQGISYARVIFHDRTLIPNRIEARHGNITNASAALVDNSSVCYLGSPDTVQTLNYFLENEESSIEISLKKR